MTKPQADAERRWVQENCPYCHSDGHTRWDNQAEWGSKSIDDYRPPKMSTSAVIDLTDNELIVNGMNGFKIHNCPMCWRKLDGK